MTQATANLQQIEETVYAVIGEDGATNFGIVKDRDDAALLIDADIRRVDEIEDALTRSGCTRVRYLLNTHENFDHSSANDYFEKKGALILGTEGCWEALRDDGEAKFAEMAGRSPELWERFPGLKMGNLQMTFPQEVALRFDRHAVRVQFAAHNGKSHSRGDAIATLDRAGILFAGDLLYTRYHPVTVYGDIPNWIASIDGLLARDFVTVVPGHGPVTSGGRDAYRSALAEFQDYLKDFHGRLGAVRAGHGSAEELAAYMKSGRYAAMGKTWMVKRNIDTFIRESH